VAELVLKRVPKAAFSVSKPASPKFKKNVKKIEKFALGIFFSPLGLRSPDAVSVFFLKKPFSGIAVRPFGVENEFGKGVDAIAYAKDVMELQQTIKEAIKQKKQISVIGAGMCQGTQTIPCKDKYLVINTKNLTKMEFGKDNATVKIQSGATWEDVQIEANKRGKSVIVKQASDIFSIGGSIGINCHGWAHEYGALSSTVISLEVIG